MKPWKIILLVVSTTLLIAPLTAYATTSMFADVPDDHMFVDDINWMKTAGITNGCGDGTNYCPNGNVTRGQMAAFMHRLSMNEVVDARTNSGVSIVAAGTVFNDGAISTGTGNFSVDHDGPGNYLIDIDGMSFDFRKYVTSVTPAAAARTARQASVGGDLVVSISTTSGAPTDSTFSFIVYDPTP